MPLSRQLLEFVTIRHADVTSDVRVLGWQLLKSWDALYLAAMNDDPKALKAAADDQSDPASMRLAAAYHEAGHAVMALSLGRLIQKVTILPSKSQFGEVRLGVCEIRKGR